MKNAAAVKLLLSLIVLIGCWKASGQGEAKEICRNHYVDATCIVLYRNCCATGEEQFVTKHTKPPSEGDFDFRTPQCLVIFVVVNPL